jgi:hypothetical protein
MSIATENRAALVAIRLHDAGPKNLKWLYRGLEVAANAKVKQILDPAYQNSVQLLSGDNVTSANFLDALDALGNNASCTAIDVVLVTHGGPGNIVFASGVDEISSAALGAALATSAAQPKLRLMYTTACYGATDAADLLAAGFNSVVGAKLKNANSLSEFQPLLQNWAGGKTIADAVAAGDRPASRMFWDMFARIGGFHEVDSEKVVAGDPLLTVSSDA